MTRRPFTVANRLFVLGGMGRRMFTRASMLTKHDVMRGGSCCNREQSRAFVFELVEVALGLFKIGWLQFDADAIAAHLCSAINLAADAKKRR